MDLLYTIWPFSCVVDGYSVFTEISLLGSEWYLVPGTVMDRTRSLKISSDLGRTGV